MRSHLFTPFTLAVCLQIALSATIALYIALASALAVAAHHQSPKCAALFSRPLAFDLVLYEGDAHFLRAARWAVRWISQTTYAFRVFFVPTTSQFGWSDACFGCCRACWPLPAHRPRWTIETTTTKPQSQLDPNANGLGCLQRSRT